MKFNKTLTAAIVALSASTGAFAQIELTTGIGFGETRALAQAQAVRAWVNQAMIDHGSADWSTAFKGPVECTQQTPTTDGGITTRGIGVEGDVNAAWVCSVSGLPQSALVPG